MMDEVGPTVWCTDVEQWAETESTGLIDGQWKCENCGSTEHREAF